MTVVVGHEHGVDEVDLLDEAGLLADRHAVTEPDRLRERNEHARAEVAERRVESDPGEDGKDGARREERSPDVRRLREDRQDAPDPDQRDERDDDPREEAESRAPLCHRSCVVIRVTSLPRGEPGAQHVPHDEHDHDPYDRRDDGAGRAVGDVHLARLLGDRLALELERGVQRAHGPWDVAALDHAGDLDR